MKRVMYLFLTVLFAGMAVMMSCSKSSDSTTTTGPAIHLLAGTGLVSGDVTVKSGAALSFGISATAGSGKLNHFLVQRTYKGKTNVAYDSTFSATTYNITLNGFAEGSSGSEIWVFTIFDGNNNSANVTLTVTTTADITYGVITAYTNTILGSWNNSNIGSSFASSTGAVYKLIDAKPNAALIDWLYYYGVTNLATIAAPNDADAATVFIGANGLNTWSHRNATTFKKVTDPIDWNIIVNDSLILIETQTGVTATDITSVQVNDVLAFITEAGKKGLLKVNAITAGDAGTITYDVKVQKTVK